MTAPAFFLRDRRWLNNEQAAADSANFISNVKIPGISTSVTAPKTPWIYYGVSPLPLSAKNSYTRFYARLSRHGD